MALMNDFALSGGQFFGSWLRDSGLPGVIIAIVVLGSAAVYNSKKLAMWIKARRTAKPSSAY